MCSSIHTLCEYSFLPFSLSYPPEFLSGGVRIKSLGSGHAGLKIVVSDLSSLRKRMKETLDAHTVGECDENGRVWHMCVLSGACVGEGYICLCIY